MWDFRSLTTHRTWEDWCGMLLGVLIVLSPWFPSPASHEVVDAERSFAVLNTFTIGILVFGLAQLEYVALQRWEEVAEIVAGLWLIAFGGLVVLLAALQLWQDWGLKDEDLLKHGQ